jgi:hypothetical protein
MSPEALSIEKLAESSEVASWLNVGGCTGSERCRLPLGCEHIWRRLAERANGRL